MSKACHVTVEWLEQCLALQKRVPEKDAGHFGQTRHTAKAEVCWGPNTVWCVMLRTQAIK